MDCHQIRKLLVESEALKGAWLPTATTREVFLYLPPRYSPNKAYPSVYFLAGWGADGELMLYQQNVFSKSLPQLFDEAIIKNALEPFIGVFPNCHTHLGGSQFVNSPATGNFMTFLCEEVVPAVEKQFATTGSKGRGVMGHSSGGFGALALGMLRPELFPFICASAADSWYEYLYVKMIPEAVATLQKYNGIEGFLKTFLNHPNPMGILSRKEGETMMLLNMCACYLPNQSAAPIFGDLFFDARTGELLPELWEKLRQWDPVNMVEAYAENLKKLEWLHLQCGLEDEYGLHLGHRQFSKKLTKKNIIHLLEEYPGRHGGHSYRYVDRVQKMISQMR